MRAMKNRNHAIPLKPNPRSRPLDHTASRRNQKGLDIVPIKGGRRRRRKNSGESFAMARIHAASHHKQSSLAIKI
jgi:hypothetical protein